VHQEKHQSNVKCQEKKKIHGKDTDKNILTNASHGLGGRHIVLVGTLMAN